MSSSSIRIICVSFLVFQFAYIYTNPLPENTARQSEVVDEYDQRQNGSENVRIHMNDFTLVVAPPDGILQLMSASANDFLSGSSDNAAANKPPTGSSTTYSATDCATENVAKCKQQTHKKNRIRLSSLLIPLLNRATGNAANNN